MNKRDRLLSLLLTTVSWFGIASLTVPTPSVLASPTPECYMVDESGQLIDLSSLCNSSFYREQTITERSPSSSERLTSTSWLSEDEQQIDGVNYPASVPLVDSNPSSIGLSVDSATSWSPLFAGSVPIVSENFPNVVYTSPRFWVRSFQETAGSRSASFTELPTLINLLQQGKPLIFIERYE